MLLYFIIQIKKVNKNKKNIINIYLMFIDSQLLINRNKFQGIEKFITCSICEGIVNIPYECLECQNNFCKNCIEKWKIKNNNCPFRCKEINFIHNRFLENILSELLKFKCEKECDEIITYKNINKHYNGECKNILNFDYKEKFEELSLEFAKLTVKNEELLEKNKELKRITDEAIADKNYMEQRFGDIKNQKLIYKKELKESRKELDELKKNYKKNGGEDKNDLSSKSFIEIKNECKNLKNINYQLNNKIKTIEIENKNLKSQNKELKKKNQKLKDFLDNEEIDYYNEDEDENDF